MRTLDNGRVTMLELTLVHACEEEALAHELGSYLAKNCGAHADYGIVSPDDQLLDVVGRALSSDIMVVLLSPNSAPKRLDRDEWEPLFIEAAAKHGTDLAYVAVADCPFPKVLVRSNSFQLSNGVRECARALKRWIFKIRPTTERPYYVPLEAGPVDDTEIENLWQTIADAPGLATAPADVACTFASRARTDFQGVFWIDAHESGLLPVMGELGAQLGLRLPDELATNTKAVRALADQYRCLVILEGAGPEVSKEFTQMGRTSILIATSDPPTLSFESAQRDAAALSSWMNTRTLAPQSAQICRTADWLLRQAPQWEFACHFARAAVAYWKFQERFAEAFALVEKMVDKAVQRQDRGAAAEFGKERGWILEGWGRGTMAMTAFAAASAPAEQLALW